MVGIKYYIINLERLLLCLEIEYYEISNKEIIVIIHKRRIVVLEKMIIRILEEIMSEFSKKIY